MASILTYRPASRLALLKPSPIRLLSEGAPVDAIPLGLGEPTWDLPEPAQRALAATSGPASYGPNLGLPELRQALACWHIARPEEVMVTTGSEEALACLFLAYLEAGDAVLVPDPGYPAYAALAHMAGAEPVPYGLDGGTLHPAGFRLALEATPHAKVAVLNFPSNPTGGVPSRDVLREVARLAEARGVLLISDEVYRELYLGQRPPTLREVTDQGVVVSSVSKAWGAASLRVGWMVGDPAILAPARAVHGYAVTCASAPCQRAALALLEHSDTVLPEARTELRARWEALAEAFSTELGQRLVPPPGAFYHWLPLPEGAGPDPMAFCLKLRDEGGVVLVPGSTFGRAGERFLRLSFAAFPEQLREGVRRMAPFWSLS